MTNRDTYKLMPNGMWYYDNGLNSRTQEQVDEANKLYYADNEEAIKEILEDGFIEFATLFDHGPEPLWSRCFLPPEFVPSCSEGFEERFGMRYNIYIPSKGRAGITKTDKMLDEYGIENYYLCIDPYQYKYYKKFHDRKHLIVRDPSLRQERKVEICCSVLAPDPLHGAAPIFNCLLYIARAVGERSYWTMDDDITHVGMKAYKGNEPSKKKYNKDDYFRCARLSPETGFDLKVYLQELIKIWDKLRNRSMLSIEKYGLVFNLPIMWRTGTRSYSFYLNDTTNPDFLGNQNSDIVSSLEMSKYGLVNVVQEGFVQYDSLDTQAQPGGTTDLYVAFGTLDKGKVLVQAEPNYSKISYLYNRIHHVCDFSAYRKQRLLGAVIKDE